VCILSSLGTKINTFIKKISKFFPKDAFRQRKRREKRLIEFLAGNRFFVDPVAIGVSTGPNRPVLAGFFPLDERDGVSEFVDKCIDLALHRLIV
jgi:hypothetical protein